MKKLQKVLLIDDSKAVNNMSEALLKSMDLFNEIHKYSDATEALDYLKNNISALPELIFLDLNMPFVDGFDFLDSYTTLMNGKDPDENPIIIIVSDHLFEHRNLDQTNKFKSVGVVNHLKKPMDKEDILGIMEEYFEDLDI